MLSDEEIHGIFYPMGTASEAQLQVARACARAIESAACAEREKLLLQQQARIAELTQQLAEARKDAERYRWLTENKHVPWGAMKLPINTLLDDGIDAAIDTAIKEQT